MYIEYLWRDKCIYIWSTVFSKQNACVMFRSFRFKDYKSEIDMRNFQPANIKDPTKHCVASLPILIWMQQINYLHSKNYDFTDRHHNYSEIIAFVLLWPTAIFEQKSWKIMYVVYYV